MVNLLSTYYIAKYLVHTTPDVSKNLVLGNLDLLNFFGHLYNSLFALFLRYTATKGIIRIWVSTYEYRKVFYSVLMLHSIGTNFWYSKKLVFINWKVLNLNHILN
jgi:hypothetical protein